MVLTYEGERFLTPEEEAQNPCDEAERWQAWKNGFREGERSETEDPPSYALSLGPVGEAYIAGWTAGNLQK